MVSFLFNLGMKCKGKSVSSNQINMKPAAPYKIFSLGDSAITIDFGNIIDEQINQKIISLFNYLTENPLPFQKELVPAFSSLAIYYNIPEIRKKASIHMTAYEWMKETCEQLLEIGIPESINQGRLIRIPVCYEKDYAMDIKMISQQKGLSVDEIIHIHTSSDYRVYMLGFLPGFAYMGKLNEQIGFARKLQPQNVQAGSVGIAGLQTGIYPLDSPGGWQIIGRTPIKMFDSNKEDTIFLKAGDTVQFYPISSNEFEDIKSRNT
jgi:inhibitor of KinA